MLSIMVQTTVMAIGPLFATCAFTTMTAKTMLASPWGPSQPIKKLFLGADSQTGKRKKHRQHSDKGQTQNGIQQDNPVEMTHWPASASIVF